MLAYAQYLPLLTPDNRDKLHAALQDREKLADLMDARPELGVISYEDWLAAHH